MKARVFAKFGAVILVLFIILFLGSLILPTLIAGTISISKLVGGIVFVGILIYGALKIVDLIFPKKKT